MLTFRRKIIVIDGLIGAGKTTFANALKTTLSALLKSEKNGRFAVEGGKAFHLPEGALWGTRYDRAVWLQAEMPQVVLEKIMDSYRNPTADNFYAAQLAVQAGRCADRYTCPPAIFTIQDRSVFSDSAFIRAQEKQDLITAKMAESLIRFQQKSCAQWCDFYHADEIDLISVYINTPIETCLKRIRLRARSGEEDISSSYLEHLKKEGGHPSSPFQDLEFPPAYLNDGFRKVVLSGVQHVEEMVLEALPHIFL